jgi:hypothetical protein
VRANALGAALELLTVIIVVYEFGNHGLNTVQRLQKMLELSGISPKRGFTDINDVGSFIDIRDNATHPEQRIAKTQEQINKSLDQATQWIEEIILWRLGYPGKYRNRCNHLSLSVDPRYDLSLRKHEWSV